MSPRTTSTKASTPKRDWRTIATWFVIAFVGVFATSSVTAQDAIRKGDWALAWRILFAAFTAAVIAGCGAVVTHLMTNGKKEGQ